MLYYIMTAEIFQGGKNNCGKRISKKIGSTDRYGSVRIHTEKHAKKLLQKNFEKDWKYGSVRIGTDPYGETCKKKLLHDVSFMQQFNR